MGNNKNQKQFARNLKKARKLHKWSQEMASRKIGISRPALGSYEENRAWPTHGTLLKIFEIYQILDIKKFLTEDYFKEKSVTIYVLGVKEAKLKKIKF